MTPTYNCCIPRRAALISGLHPFERRARLRQPAKLLSRHTHEVFEGAKPSAPFRGGGFFVPYENSATPPKEQPEMTLANERPEEPDSLPAPADEQLALALLKLIEEQGASRRLHSFRTTAVPLRTAVRLPNPTATRLRHG